MKKIQILTDIVERLNNHNYYSINCRNIESKELDILAIKVLNNKWYALAFEIGTNNMFNRKTKEKKLYETAEPLSCFYDKVYKFYAYPKKTLKRNYYVEVIK